jgi:hypothetical protein
VPVLFLLDCQLPQLPATHCPLPVLVLNINLRYIGRERTKMGIAASENMPIAETYIFVNTCPSPLGILNEYKAN